MRLVFFDTETTGKIKNFKIPLTEKTLDNFPRLVQLAYIVQDENQNELALADYVIKPVGFEIPIEASNVHGITQEQALTEGQDLYAVLDEFYEELKTADFHVGHNISFDLFVVYSEFTRINIDAEKTFYSSFDLAKIVKPYFCTMKLSTNYCQIPGPYGWKWPKLQELHFKLFGENFEDAHNALNDIRATAKCFWKLKELGVIK